MAVVMIFYLIGAEFSHSGTLNEVKKRGELVCGVSTGIPGFSNPDTQGVWKGLDVDLCKAIAAATLGDALKVKFVPLTGKERFSALQSGEIDILARNTAWTLTRDTLLGLHFCGVNYYDGQGFLVSKSLGVKSALELNGTAICLQSGTTTELNVADYFKTNKMTYKPIIFDTPNQLMKGFETGRCDVLTSDRSQLYALRSQFESPDETVVLPQVISKEPLGPVVRQGDDAWFNIVKWSLFAMILAEEYGVTSHNVEEMKTSSNLEIQRLLGMEGNKGKGLGLKNDWAYQLIKQVGNYGESYERNVGQGSPLKIERGLNSLWTRGGILFAPPIR